MAASYVQARAREVAGELTRNELQQLIAVLRLIHAERVRRTAKHYRQPTPIPQPMGRPPLRFS